MVDWGNNGNSSSNVITVTADLTPPALVLTTPLTSVTGPFVVTGTTSETVSGFNSGDVTVSNGTISSFSGGGTSYSWTVTPSATGNVLVSVAADRFTDGLGNDNLASNQLAVDADLSTPSNVLISGVPVSDSVGDGDWDHYTITLPGDATGLLIEMTGAGDADLYTRFGAQPTFGTWDYRPYYANSNETVTYSTVTPGGTYHISVHGYSSATYDFDDGEEGWTNPDGNYGWDRDKNGTPSGSTGPSVDHTYGNSNGYYFYMEASDGYGPNDPSTARRK
jgi:hypothetical protein